MAFAMFASRVLLWEARWKCRGLVVIAMLALLCVGLLRAQEATSEEVIERYEQILERAPVEGPSLDKLLQIYEDGEGLEKLDARWAPWSAQPGAKGATYSLLRGLLADRMGKIDEARKLLQAAAQAQPDDFHGWMALGDFEARQGKWTDAIAALQKGLATPVTGDDRLSLYRKLGQAQERNLATADALATWQKMVEEFPKDSFALEEAGTAELDEEQFDEAKKTFQKLVDLTEPNSMNRVQALMRLAEVDDRQGKTDAAVHDYEAILPLTAESSWLNRELRAQIEQVYRREDDLAGLVSYYQKWTQDNPKDVEALLLLAGTLTELGKKNDALDVMRKVTVLAPDRHEVRQSFGQALVEAKQYDEAITVETALTADDPTEPRYWETMGDALWLKTQPPTPESKKATLDAWAHIDPPDSSDVAAVLELADLCHEHGLNDEALAGYQRALKLSPDASDIREKAVKLLVEMNRPDDAWKLLDQMTDGALATAANYLKLATLDLQFQRKDAAGAAVQKGLALEPGNFDLLSQQWSLFADAQKWTDCIALFDKLIAAAPNDYFIDQLEARHLQALTSAGQIDDTGKRLHAKLGATPGLTEGELRLLLRIMIQQSDADIPKALDEAHRRFPQSVSLIRIEIDYNRHQGNYDAAVAALQRLIQTQPKQTTDWLEEMVHVRQDQGNLDEALKTAQQIIDASPTSADGYLLYADIAFNAGKTDDAVAKLLAAIKLSDKPNDVRQRLARYYLESGQAAKARTIYDDAFAAADNPQEKLTIVRAMTTAYFQDGQIEELVNRFKKEQSSEEGGWRYGLYLSAIDEQMEDYGAARRELAKSLAVRPNDTGLLHSLIGLAEKENDLGELLRYREMLADADPSATNELALANEYAAQDKPEDAWRIVQKNLGEVVKDPMAWKDVLNQITDPAYAAKIKGVLEDAIRSKGDAFEGKFALAQFQMQQGDLDGAKSTLWEILEQPLPPAPPPKPASATNPLMGAMFGMGGFYQSRLFQRATQSYMAMNEAQQLLASAQMRTQMRQQQMMMRSMFSQMGVTTTLDPTAIKDHALVYLSVIALQQKQAEDFLKQLQAKFEAWHWPLSEKLVAYSQIQARGPLLDAIEEQAKSSAPDKELDEYCFMGCEQFLNANPGLVTDDATRKRAQAAQAAIGARLAQDAQFKNMVAMMQIQQLAGDTSPDAVAKRKAAVENYAKTVDHKNPEELIDLIGLCAQVGDWDAIKHALDDLAATDHTKWSAVVTQQLNFLPMSLIQQVAVTKDTTSKQVIPAILELMRLSYPATPPHPALAGTTQNRFFGMGFFNQNTFPPPNRYFGADRIGAIEPMFQQLKAAKMLPDMYTALDQEEKDLTDWRKIYPELLRVYFQWWDGKRDDAIASVRKLLEQDPSDDFRQLLAAMLTQEQKYDEAIPVLESVTARYGPDYIQTQMQLLHTARMAKNNDVGQKAALRLLALRLPQQEQMQILDDLRNVGLKDKADAIVAKQTNTGPGANINQVFQANNQLMQSLNGAMNQSDQTLAVDLAHQILNRDPLAPNTYGNESYLRTEALNALKRFGQLETYAHDVEQQLQATPDSVRLNWLAAEAYQSMDDHLERTMGLAPLPQWIKLTRTGNSIEGFYSLDGANWISVGQTTLELPGKVDVGFWVSAERFGPTVKANVDQIAFTGKTGLGDAPAPAAPPSTPTAPGASSIPAGNTTTTSTTSTSNGVTSTFTTTTTTIIPGSTFAANVAATPSVPAGTNAPAAMPPTPTALPAPWQQTDIGDVTQPGSVSFDASGAMSLTGAVGGKPPVGGGDHYVYQMLDGDGSVVARVNQLTGSSESRTETVGIMLRESVVPGSVGALIALNPTRGVEWRSRSKTASGPNVKLALNGSTANAEPASEIRGWTNRGTGQFVTPIWLKLSRKGDTFTGSSSNDGQRWNDVFSTDVAMGPDSRVGVMAAVNGAPSASATWTDIKVTSAQAPGVSAPLNPAAPEGTPASPPGSGGAPATTTLPSPWEFIDLGGTPQHGSAQFNGPELTLNSAVPITNQGARSYSFVYQPAHADSEIVAHLTSQLQPGFQHHDGLCFRSRLDQDSPEVEFFRTNVNQIGYYLKTDTAGMALKYYQRVAELDPKNQQVLIQIAEQLRRAKKTNAAADLYASILKSDFPGGMAQSYNVLQAFEDANRLPDLVKIIQDWTPPPLNPMGGGGQDMYFTLVQVGTQLRQKSHLPEAEQVYRKALSVDTFQSKQDGEAALVQILMDENRRDDASAEIEKFLLNAGSPSATTPPPILGFSYQIQGQNNWFMSVSWGQNGVINSPMVHFLELADELGLTAKLEQELKARADKKGPPLAGQLDQDRMTCLLLEIIAHDPNYRSDVEKMLKETPVTSLNMGNAANAFLILGQQLATWPQERPMALRLISTVYDGMSTNQNSFFRNVAGLELLRIAQAMGDHKTVQATLRSIADSIREQRAANANQVQVDQVLMIARYMIQEGMLKEAADQLADAKADPQLANNNVYYQQRIDQVQSELDFAQGKETSVALIYGVTDSEEKSKAGGREIFWQINPGEKARGNMPFFSNTAWMTGVPVRPTTYRMEVNGGPDEQHVTTHLASFPNVSTQGKQAIKIPAGIMVVQATLIGSKTDVPVTPAPPSASGTNPPIGPAPAPAPNVPGSVAIGHLVLLGGSENLLKNPGFEESKDATGKSVLAGWSGLTLAGISRQDGGPLPTGGYQSLEGGGGMFGGASEIISDKIAIQPNTNYVLGGWMHLSGNVAVRYLDAAGKVLNPNQLLNSDNAEGWEWRSWLLKGNSQGPERGGNIPAQAAFVEIVLSPNQNCDVAGLSLRVLPAVAPTPAPAPAPPAGQPAPAPAAAPKPPPTI